MTLYKCEMMFSVSFGFKTVNDILSQCGYDEQLHIKDAGTFTVTQVLPEIPDEEYLRKVADIIKDNYETKELNVIECHFAGYKNIRMVKPEEVENGSE